MKFKVLLIFVGIFLMIFFFFWFYFKVPKKDVCKDFEFPQLKEICYAAFSKKLTLCLNFKGLYKELCANAVLSNLKVSPEFCSSLKDEILKNSCYRKLAKTTKDFKWCRDEVCYFLVSLPEACEKMNSTSSKFTCLAKATNEMKYCDYLEDEFERISCKGFFASDPEICKVNETYVPYCLLHVAQNGDWKVCLKGPNSFFKAMCVGFASKSLEDCEVLDELKDLCKIFYLERELDAV